jgi:SAM-dependent MidA family methyltransferase
MGLGHNDRVGSASTSFDLWQIVVREIGASGPITFARFMELALYHPEFGYYRTRDRFGVQGDFYTAEQLQPVFGESLAHFVEKLTKRDETGAPYRVLEIGAGRGEMAHALSRWDYRAFDWSSAPLPRAWSGLVLANEFFDSLPVHLLTRTAESWKELYVASSGADLCFSPGELSDPLLAQYAVDFGAAATEGGRVEVCLELKDWCERLAELLAYGDLLVVDYGYYARELARFPQGTLTTYKQHRATTASVLLEPGQRDITAHVNFSWLEASAKSAGFTLHSSTTLARWLLSAWDEPELGARWQKVDQRWKLQWKQLLISFGETFRVLHFERKPAGQR